MKRVLVADFCVQSKYTLQPLQVFSSGNSPNQSPPSLPSPPLPLLQSATIANKFFPPYFHHMATSFQLWKHKGHPTLYQVNPNFCWPLACRLSCCIFSKSSGSVLPPVLLSEATFICVGRKCPLGFHNSPSSRPCPRFTSAWSSPHQQAMAIHLPVKAQHFLCNKPREPRSCVV